MKPVLRVFPDQQSLSRSVAEAVSRRAQTAMAENEYFSLALSGGRTPATLFRLLATDYLEQIDWTRVQVFWGDERYVPWEDARSNYRLAWETVLSLAPIPPENLHPMPTDFVDPEEAAITYETLLKNHYPDRVWPRLDLVLLGLGADGHTASLFPGSAALAEQQRWVVATRSEGEEIFRLSLTLPVLNQAACLYFLVTGTEKAEALRRAVLGPPDPIRFPASAVQPVDGELIWWADQSAAQFLSHMIFEGGG